MILKTWASLDEYSYGIEFNWNGKLISPDPKNKENQAYTGKGWKKIKVHGILYKYKVLNDKFNNQVNIAFDYTADTADGINGIWKVGEGATKIINANNTSDLENGISIFTEGKEKLDRNGGKIIEVIEGISNASDVATAGSLLVCVETAGGGCVAAGGSWAIKKGTLYFGGKKAKRIVRKYFGEKGFRSIKKKIERKILGLLRSGKVSWNDINNFFIKSRTAIERLIGKQYAYAVAHSGTFNLGFNSVKEGVQKFYSKVWGAVKYSSKALKYNRKKASELLKNSEKVGGHTFEKHIAKSDDFLKNRVQKNINQNKKSGIDRKINPSTSFYDQKTAEVALRDALNTDEGQKALKNVINLSRNGKKTYQDSVKYISKNISSDIGYGYKVVDGKVGKITEKITDVEVVLRPDGKGGYYLTSIYPKL